MQRQMQTPRDGPSPDGPAMTVPPTTANPSAPKTMLDRLVAFFTSLPPPHDDANIAIDTLFASFSDAERAWASEAICDPSIRTFRDLMVAYLQSSPGASAVDQQSHLDKRRIFHTSAMRVWSVLRHDAAGLAAEPHVGSFAADVQSLALSDFHDPQAVQGCEAAMLLYASLPSEAEQRAQAIRSATNLLRICFSLDEVRSAMERTPLLASRVQQPPTFRPDKTSFARSAA